MLPANNTQINFIKGVPNEYENVFQIASSFFPELINENIEGIDKGDKYRFYYYL